MKTTQTNPVIDWKRKDEEWISLAGPIKHLTYRFGSTVYFLSPNS
jgi:hypothetical protein